jgi:hypothetical protein
MFGFTPVASTCEIVAVEVIVYTPMLEGVAIIIENF